MCQGELDRPPTLSSRVIKNLGIQFCNVSEEEISDSKLSGRTKKQPPIKKKNSKPSLDDGSESEASSQN